MGLTNITRIAGHYYDRVACTHDRSHACTIDRIGTPVIQDELGPFAMWTGKHEFKLARTSLVLRGPVIRPYNHKIM
jgi:hypothetical protein